MRQYRAGSQEEQENFQRIRELTKARILKRKRQRRKELITHVALCSAVVIIFLTITVVVLSAMSKKEDPDRELKITKVIEDTPDWREDLLTVNAYSRPGTELKKVKGVVIHYTGNPGTTAAQNRSYFQGLAESHATKASSHFIVGLSGEIILCVPLDEIAYASNERNVDTISIECCIDNEAGRFNEKTYDALVELTAWLVSEYDLEAEDIIRHFDVTGKNCPKYFVEHESAWEDFKIDVVNYIQKNGVEK